MPCQRLFPSFCSLAVIHPFWLSKHSLKPAHTSPTAYPPCPPPLHLSTPWHPSDPTESCPHCPPPSSPPHPPPCPTPREAHHRSVGVGGVLFRCERGVSTALELRHHYVSALCGSCVITAARQRWRRVTATWEGRGSGIIAAATRRGMHVTAAWEGRGRGIIAARGGRQQWTQHCSGTTSSLQLQSVGDSQLLCVGGAWDWRKGCHCCE